MRTRAALQEQKGSRTEEAGAPKEQSSYQLKFHVPEKETWILHKLLLILGLCLLYSHILFKHLPTPEPIADREKELWGLVQLKSHAPLPEFGVRPASQSHVDFQMEMEGDGGNIGHTTSCPLSFLLRSLLFWFNSHDQLRLQIRDCCWP